MSDDFIDLSLNRHNMDVYVIRKSVLYAIESRLPAFKGAFLDIGCGKMPYRKLITENSKIDKYVGLDINSAIVYDSNVQPDFTWDGKSMPFRENSFESAMATEVLEHCPEPELVLAEAYRILKPGGCFFFTIPFLWNLHEVPHDEYRYTPFAIKRHLEKTGFKNIEICAHGGWHTSMAQMLGLWVRRSGLERYPKYLFSQLAVRIIEKLLAMDKNKVVEFNEGQMISGLSGIAFKNEES
jgi:SAM-dependent methyltransferase